MIIIIIIIIKQRRRLVALLCFGFTFTRDSYERCTSTVRHFIRTNTAWRGGGRGNVDCCCLQADKKSLSKELGSVRKEER
jgi:hypothetical protein